MAPKTYARVVQLLNDEIPAKISRNEFSRITGINRNSLDRYKGGIGTPILETLQKLSDYFKVPVPWLQGHWPEMSYEAAKEHRKAVESGQRSGWIEGVEPVVDLQHKIQVLLFRAVSIIIGGGDPDYIKRVIAEIEETMPSMDDGWKRVFAGHLDRLGKMLPGKKSKK